MSFRYTFQPQQHAQLLLRVFDLSRGGMTRVLAESIVALDFPDEDAARIEELNTKANEGTLTDEEVPELDAYVHVSDLLAFWQSKALQVLYPPA